MSTERTYKILMATGIDAIDSRVGTLPECEVAGICRMRESLRDDIRHWNPQVVIASDWLKGDENLPSLLADLKRQNHYMRFIYLAGRLDPRDQNRIDELGRMVLSGIYDICISNEINMDVIDNLIKNPKEEASVSYLAKNILNSDSPSEFVKDDPVLSGLPDVAGIAPGTMDNVYVFTSIKPGTGKSFLSVNVACAIAAYGKEKEDGEKPKVALLEADLQTLSIGTILNIKENRKKTMKEALTAISSIFDRGNIIGDDNDLLLVEKIIRNCMVPYGELPNLHVLTGSLLTPEEIDSMKISPEYYVYLLDVIRKYYDVVIIDTNSSMFHITTYPVLQKACRCYYIINLDINNVRNNLRYYSTLKKLGLVSKIRWICNENIENSKAYKDQGVATEELAFTADQFEEQYFTLSARIPAVPKAVFLNRIYNGVPIVLDKDVPYTKDVKAALIKLAGQIWEIPEDAAKPQKKSGGLLSLFAPKPKKAKQPKPEKKKAPKQKEKPAKQKGRSRKKGRKQEIEESTGLEAEEDEEEDEDDYDE